MLKQKGKALAADLFEGVFPEHLTCDFCEAELPPHAGESLCTACRAAIEVFDGAAPRCSVCGRPIAAAYAQHAPYGFRCALCQEQFFYFSVHRAYARYTGVLKEALMQLKYTRKRYIAVTLGALMAERPELTALLEGVDYVVPVPIHGLRYMRRGYNQAHEIALSFCRHAHHAPPVPLLARRHKTKKLKNLDKASRKRALENAIMVKKAYQTTVSGKRILLVDDIYTTGSTLSACARTLYEAGADDIRCLTVAQGIFSDDAGVRDGVHCDVRKERKGSDEWR